MLDDDSDKLIFNECKKNPKINNLCKKISLDSIGNCLLPPLEILYVIIKSHIHRLIPIVSYQEQNIEIWHTHITQYTKIREKLGYTKLDDILDNDYLGSWRVIDSSNNELENLMRKIYQKRFIETTKRVGDTIISLEKSEENFSNDNVKRFVQHDDLHEEVGIICRNDKHPIFKKYQTDPTSVSLDRDIFLKANKDEKIQMMREEIIVLLLERKWIPDLK
jgi:hypothetical protein